MAIPANRRQNLALAAGVASFRRGRGALLPAAGVLQTDSVGHVTDLKQWPSGPFQGRVQRQTTAHNIMSAPAVSKLLAGRIVPGCWIQAGCLLPLRPVFLSGGVHTSASQRPAFDAPTCFSLDPASGCSLDAAGTHSDEPAALGLTLLGGSGSAGQHRAAEFRLIRPVATKR